MIRVATEHDLPVLREIERAAGAGFAEIGMTAVAQDEPPSLADLSEFRAAERAWVYVDGSDTPVAYVLVSHVDGNGHLEQVSVHPDHAGNRIGQALIEHAMAWARAAGLPAMTLTTFTHVAWNGPYYEKLGFDYMTSAEETPQLHAIRAQEIDRGLDRWPRACMRIGL